MYTSLMASKRYNVGEARRLLPELVRTIASEGGRVDITHRGEARVTLLRTSDVHVKAKPSQLGLPRALRVELGFPAQQLQEVLREVRGQSGARFAWLPGEAPKAAKVRKSPKAKRTKP